MLFALTLKVGMVARLRSDVKGNHIVHPFRLDFQGWNGGAPQVFFCDVFEEKAAEIRRKRIDGGTGKWVLAWTETSKNAYFSITGIENWFMDYL